MPIARTQRRCGAGAIDAAESSLPAYVASRHHEVARFYSLTEHTMSPGVLVFSKRVWDKLSPGRPEDHPRRRQGLGALHAPDVGGL